MRLATHWDRHWGNMYLFRQGCRNGTTVPILVSGSTGGRHCSFQRTMLYTVLYICVGTKPVTGTKLLAPANIIFNTPVRDHMIST